METTAKRISLALTAGDLQQVSELCEHFKENQTSVIKRAMIMLHYITFHEVKLMQWRDTPMEMYKKIKSDKGEK